MKKGMDPIDGEEEVELLAEDQLVIHDGGGEEDDVIFHRAHDQFTSSKNQGKKKPEAEDEDPVLKLLGGFGLCQALVSLNGFFLTIPHAFASLSLKFVGMRTNFTCSSLELEEKEVHSVPDGLHAQSAMLFDNKCNRSSMASGGESQTCDSFEYDESHFISTIVQRYNLICNKEGLDSVAQSVFFAGCLVGVILSGMLADRLGRKTVMLWLMVIFVLAGVAGGLVTSFPVWLALRFALGFASIGLNTARYTLQIEMISSKWRTWASSTGALGWVTGYMLLPGLAYVIPNMAHLEIFIGLTGAPFFMLYWLHPESPKWLASVGRTKEAASVINSCRWLNSLPPIQHLEGRLADVMTCEDTTTPKSDGHHDRKADVGGGSRGGLIRMLFYPGLRRNLLAIQTAWFSIGMAYFGLALHTPEFGSNVYMVFFLSGLFELPMCFIAPFMLNRLGRKTCLCGSLFATSLSLLVSSLLNSGVPFKNGVIIGLATFGKLSTGLSFECCYIWTSELFPTVVRNSCLSVCSSLARLGAIIAPLIVEIDKDNPLAPLLVYGGVCLAASCCSTLISPETLNRPAIPNTLEEGEKLAQSAHARSKSTSGLGQAFRYLCRR